MEKTSSDIPACLSQEDADEIRTEIQVHLTTSGDVAFLDLVLSGGFKGLSHLTDPELVALFEDLELASKAPVLYAAVPLSLRRGGADRSGKEVRRILHAD